ncbi:MAG: hypothetical protein HQ565_12365 [Bacteroidetes bacterium]|nr:hypothetical protein [Bacteroidota bacterium]
MRTTNTGNLYVSWTLRVLLILMILFFALFSLDVFDEGQGFWDTSVAFMMHNIPSFAMIIILIIAWKWEHIGGALLMLCILGFAIFLFVQSDNFMYGTLIMVGIPFLIGMMFVINHYYLGKRES